MESDSLEDLNGVTVIDDTTGEMLSVEQVVEEYVRLKNYSVTKKRDSIDKLIERLQKDEESLTKEDILRIAKKCNAPINSFYSFYMVSLSPYYMDVEMSKNASSVLNKMLKMVVNGHLIDRYANNKPILTMKGFYESLGVTRPTFYRAKSELEKNRMIKCLEGKDSFVVLFNPIYVRCGQMDEATFFEFEEEIKEYNYIEWLYFKKVYSVAGNLRVRFQKGE